MHNFGGDNTLSAWGETLSKLIFFSILYFTLMQICYLQIYKY